MSVETPARAMARAPMLIELLRGWFRNDGAEGETVHALCDSTFALREEVARLEVEVTRLRALVSEATAYAGDHL